MSNSTAIDVAALESAVAAILGLATSEVQVCLLSDTASLTTIVIGVPLSVSQLNALTNALSSGNIAGLTLTESPTVFALTPSSGVVGDPQFSGFRGQSFQVHGIDGAVYNIISSPTMHVNARFVFLSSGECPVLDGKRDGNCWSHPGSYLGEIGMRVRSTDGSDEHRLLVNAGDSKTGFAAVSVDGVAVSVGTAVQPAADIRVERVSTHQLLVSTAQFSFVLDNSDMFINQAVRLNVPLSQLSRDSVHGLLGQTHRPAMGARVQVVEGEVDDYVVSEGDVFGTDCVYNRYNGSV